MKKGLKVKVYSMVSIISGLLCLQAITMIVLLILSDLGAPKAADLYPLTIYPTTAWWVYAALTVSAIILFCFSVYFDNLCRKEEDKIALWRFKKLF